MGDEARTSAARESSEVQACCGATDLDARISTFFDKRQAGRHGQLPPLSPVTVSLLEAIGPDAAAGATILELGAGTGGLAVELLKRGATHVTGVDLSATSLAAAGDRAVEAGIPNDRVTFIAGDAVLVDVDPHDWVVLDRSICCYADVDRLLARAIGSARKRIAYSVPESDGWRSWLQHIRWWFQDTWDTLRGNRPSPGYFHSVERIEAQLTAAGFKPTRRWRYRLWRLAIFDRAA
jgi:SAM-dependent methyltransferase